MCAVVIRYHVCVPYVCYAMFLGMYPSCTMCAAWHVVRLCVPCAPALPLGMYPWRCARAHVRGAHAFVCALAVHRLVILNVYGRWTESMLMLFVMCSLFCLWCRCQLQTL